MADGDDCLLERREDGVYIIHRCSQGTMTELVPGTEGTSTRTA